MRFKKKKKEKHRSAVTLSDNGTLSDYVDGGGGGGGTKGKQKTKRKTEVEETCMENSSAFRETCGVHEGSSERR